MKPYIVTLWLASLNEPKKFGEKKFFGKTILGKKKFFE